MLIVKLSRSSFWDSKPSKKHKEPTPKLNAVRYSCKKSSILSFKYVPGYSIVTTTKIMCGLCLQSLELWLFSEYIQLIE